MKEDDSDNKLKEEEEEWGIGRGIEYGLVPVQQHVRICWTSKSRGGHTQRPSMDG
jgi:hypothetical protein